MPPDLGDTPLNPGEPASVEAYPDLGMEMKSFALTLAQAASIDNSTQHLLNNSSYVIVLTYRNWKLIVSGDNEVSGWQKLLENDAFCNSVRGVSFFVTSHHGHESGFSTELFDVMGRPWINITSEKSGDEGVSPLYSSEQYAKGITYGERKRYHLTTRQDGNIVIRVVDEEHVYVDAHFYPDNIW